MFGFFVDGEFKGLWANKPGDVFYDLTLNAMGWDSAELYYYENLSKLPEDHSFELSEEKAKLLDSEQNIVSEHPAIGYVVNGEKLKEC